MSTNKEMARANDTSLSPTEEVPNDSSQATQSSESSEWKYDTLTDDYVQVC